MLLKLRLPAELELEKLSVQMHRWVAVNQQGQESKAQEAAGSTYLYPLRVASQRQEQRKGGRCWSAALGFRGFLLDP